jgi:hypothetical protein
MKSGNDRLSADEEWVRRFEGLISRLPARLHRPLRWLRRPSSRWLRLPVALLLICGSALSILPVFGLWMLPLGLLLLAEDLTPLRGPLLRMFDWAVRRWQHHVERPLRRWRRRTGPKGKG